MECSKNELSEYDVEPVVKVVSSNDCQNIVKIDIKYFKLDMLLSSLLLYNAYELNRKDQLNDEVREWQRL